LGTFNTSARNSMQALLALPSSGGAVSFSLRASLCSPTIWLREAPGWT